MRVSQLRGVQNLVREWETRLQRQGMELECLDINNACYRRGSQ